MYIKRYLSPLIVYYYSWRMVLFSLFTSLVAIFAYSYLSWKWVAIPWLPVSLVGTATAFFVGFKNNQSYDRSWEARKVWGSITNHSRSFGAALKAYYSKNDLVDNVLDENIRIIIYRHIAWLYALKNAMWQRTSWEHKDRASMRQRDTLQSSQPPCQVDIEKYLASDEHIALKGKKNLSTQILDKQSQHLARLRESGSLDTFQHIALQELICNLYDEQGKTERIKNTPFPRQYATTSNLFIIVFMTLLPFGLLPQFVDLGEEYKFLMIPLNMIVSWVFMFMEYVGDISENPFEGLLNDIPVGTIVRNIEIDLIDMLDEAQVPEKIQPFFGALF
ncbi:bestrophin family protein [Algoriphagus sp. NG3]|uniref:bestrophin family protein n=1 Tax=Algoriphagus sp. NG3 TaxID=3097546 RepID=UPI002A808D18|nr:bestrophin family ion channel [Algoriphagus sp. NG3]WPR77315.1 bestrophin family ion channel [Algoriphagus sp. NG3]